LDAFVIGNKLLQIFVKIHLLRFFINSLGPNIRLLTTGIVICLLLNACANKPYIVPFEQTENQVKSQTIYITRHEWHTGFVIPSEAIMQRLPELRQRFPQAPMLEFGWGDKGFYQTYDITTLLVLRAIFLPTSSVMHVVLVPRHPKDYFPKSSVHSLNISEQQLLNLIEFIRASFELNKFGEPTAQINGLYGDSQFYNGVGHYFLFNTCNSWTARGLKSAGFDINTLLKLNADSVMNYVSKY